MNQTLSVNSKIIAHTAAVGSAYIALANNANEVECIMSMCQQTGEICIARVSVLHIIVESSTYPMAY